MKYPKNVKFPYRLVADGNSKLGKMFAMSTLAGTETFSFDESHEIRLINGTCPINCNGCYGKNGNYARFVEVRYGLAKITWGVRNEINEMFECFNAQLHNTRKALKVVRIHANGDLDSMLELEKWLWLASENTDTKFYIYTKRVQWIASVADILPSNFIVNVSVYDNYGYKEAVELVHKYPSNFNAFVVNTTRTASNAYPLLDDLKKVTCTPYGKVEIGALKHKVKRNPNGKSCIECGMCWGKIGTGLVIYCNEH